MNNTVLQRTIALRAEVWRELVNSPSYQSFKALDVAVAAMGGKRVLSAESPDQSDSPRPATTTETVAPRRRASQGDVAEAMLRAAKEPMTIRPLLDAVVANGVEVRGEDPLEGGRDRRLRGSAGLCPWFL